MGVVIPLFEEGDRDEISDDNLNDVDGTEVSFGAPTQSGTAFFADIARRDAAEQPKGGQAWRESRVRIETAILELETMIENSDVLTKVWKQSLLYAVYMVRTAVITHEAFMVIVVQAEKYIQNMRRARMEGVSPGEFIRDMIFEYVMTQRRAQVESRLQVERKGDERMVEIGRAAKAARVKSRRNGLRVVR